MKNLVTFNAREVNRDAVKKRKNSIPLQSDSESQSKRQSILTSFSKIEGKGLYVWFEEQDN